MKVSNSDTVEDIGNSSLKKAQSIKPIKQPRLYRGVVLLRFLVISCIVIAATVVGYGSYEILRKYEYDYYIDEYNEVMTNLIPATTQGKQNTYCYYLTT